MKTQNYAAILVASTVLITPASGRAVHHGLHSAGGHAEKLGLAPSPSASATLPAGKAFVPAPVSATPQPHATQEDVVVHAIVLPNGVTRTAAGGGLMVNDSSPRARQFVTQDYIAKQPATANPEQLLQMQPGANVTMGDPFGFSVGHMTVRGLDIGEIGWLLDGMPFNNGAVYPNEIVDSANLTSIALTPGSVDFDIPTFGAAGGVVDMVFRDPSHKAGGFVNIGYGSYKYNNQFLRLESGDIGNTGLRGFFSFSHSHSDVWHGPGFNDRHHIDFKLAKDWENGSKSAFSLAWNHQTFMLDRWPTLGQWQQYGTKWTYDARFTPGTTTYWGVHQSMFDNVAVSAVQHIRLSHRLELVATPYFFHGGGASPGAAVLNSSNLYSGNQQVTNVNLPLGNGTGTSSQNTVMYTPNVYDQYRTGANLSLNYTLGAHKLTLGYWYEYNNASTVGHVGYISQSGMPANTWASSGLLRLNNGSLYQSSNTLTLGQVNGLYVGDRATFLNDKLQIEGGFKEVMYTMRGYNQMPGAVYNRNVHYAIPLPTLAMRYNFNKEHQLYVNVGTNFLTPSSSQLFDVYSMTTGKKVQQGDTLLKPEYSIVEELGYRYQGSFLNASLTLFNYNFTNRQVSTTIVQNGAQVSQYINAGGQTTRGLDAQIGFRPWHHLRPYVSAEYLHATTDNDMVTSSGDLLPTAGKTAVRSPHVMVNAALDYDDGHFFGNISMHYVSSQYSTFMADQKMPGYVTSNMTLGYRFSSIGPAKSPTIQLNLVNLANNHYLGGVYSVQNNAHATTGVRGTVIAASGQPTYLAGAGFAAIASWSTGF